MREILFRGKQIDNSEWIVGFYCCEKVGAYTTNVFIRASLGYGVWVNSRVDHKTVGQFTGLTDKNGKMIFEGDILEFRRGRTHIVNFEDGAFVFTGTAIPVRYADKFEVIGNIHDNPELIEVE